jgi:hypothetical protein
MLGLEVDTSELLKWSRLMRNVPKRTKAAIARALNTVGDNIVHNAVEYNAEATGLDPSDLERLIVVKKATPDDLTWSMDQSAILTKTNFARPWETPDDGTFDQSTLVKVITQNDDYVCEKCIDVADHSPYTLEEVRNLNPYGPDFGTGTNLVHPNCRCATAPWQATRELPVSVVGTDAPPELFTMRQLGQAVAAEMQVAIFAKD